MNETQTHSAQGDTAVQTTEQTGIFEPKPLDTDKLPLSGPQKAFRLLIILTVLILTGLVLILMRNPFMKPVKIFYRGLSHSEIGSMTDAFPKWLTDAAVSEGSVTTADMCSAVLSATELEYGKDVKAKVSLVSKTEVSKDYLERIQSGIKTQYHTDVTITKGYWVRLRVLYQFKGIEAEVTRYARVYKINGKWCLLDVPSESQ